MAARLTADAATASAAAMANRAETPDRESTAGRRADQPGEPRDHLDQVLGQHGVWLVAVPGDPGLLPDQRQLGIERGRVVSADLGAEPVLEGRDDPAPVGVVLRVGAGHEHQVEREPQGIAADADVTFLQHVEQRDLDPLGQVGKLVQAEDAPVGPRHQAEVNRLGVAEGPAFGHLHRVNVADQVAHAGVRGGELLAVAVAARPPGDRQVFLQLGAEAAAARAHRLVRVIIDLASRDGGRPLIQQAGERADQPGLALPALAEQDDVVPGNDGALQLGQHRLPEPDDPGESVFAGSHPGQQITPYLLLDGQVLMPARAELG